MDWGSDIASLRRSCATERSRGSMSLARRRMRRLDDLMVQKVLVKLRGTEKTARPAGRTSGAIGGVVALDCVPESADARTGRVRLVSG